MTGFEIYLLMLLDSLEGIGITVMVLTAALMLIIAITWSEHDEKEAKPLAKACLVAFILSVLCLVFIPNTKQALTIMGVSYVTQNERIEKNVDKTIDLFEQIIDEKLSERED